DRLAGVRGPEAAERVDHPGLHGEERLAAGEREPARVALDARPLLALAGGLQLHPRPLADVELDQAVVDDDLATGRLGDRSGCLPGPLQRRGVQGGYAREQVGDPLRGVLRLAPSLVGQVEPGGTPGEVLAGRRGRAVADEHHDGRPGAAATPSHPAVRARTGSALGAVGSGHRRPNLSSGGMDVAAVDGPGGTPERRAGTGSGAARGVEPGDGSVDDAGGDAVVDPAAVAPEIADLAELEAAVTRCRACPRLVAWREQV